MWMPVSRDSPGSGFRVSRGERVQPMRYGLFAVCSAVNENVGVVVAPW